MSCLQQNALQFSVKESLRDIELGNMKCPKSGAAVLSVAVTIAKRGCASKDLKRRSIPTNLILQGFVLCHQFLNSFLAWLLAG